MLKILLVIGVIAFVYYFFIKKKPQVPSEKKNKEDSKPQSSDMVECATCGTYCDLSEAILSNGKYYCSSECVKGS